MLICDDVGVCFDDGSGTIDTGAPIIDPNAPVTDSGDPCDFNSVAYVRLLDWRSPEKFSPFDVLIASDVAYESRSFKPLLKALKLLVKPDGIVLISEPNRKFAKEFFNELNKDGFTMTSEIRNVNKDGLKYKISIYQLNRA